MREVLVAVELSCCDVLDLLQLSYLYLSEPLRVGDRIVILLHAYSRLSCCMKCSQNVFFILREVVVIGPLACVGINHNYKI